MKIEFQMVVDGVVHSLSDEGMGPLLEAMKVKKTFGGLEVTTEYGDVEVHLAGKKYVLRIGTREWDLAEDAFKPVKGVQAIVRHINSSEKAIATFYGIALSRYQKMTAAQVGDLLDFKPKEGEPTLRNALDLCLHFSRPAVFTDEEVDPKGTAAIELAFLAMAQAPTTTNLPELTTS